MLKQLIGKQCVNPACKRKGELVDSGALCEECGSILQPIEKWNWRSLTALALVGVAMGAGTLFYCRGRSPVPPPPLPCCAPPPAPSEIAFAFTFELLGDNQNVSFVAPDRVFHSGDRFRVVLKPDFNAFVYVFNQNPDEAQVQVLYPVAAKTASIQPKEEARAPGNEGWFRMDKKPGSEVLILVASPNPLPELGLRDGTVNRRDFESWLARTEEDGKPKSQRIFQNAAWTNLMADSTQSPLVFVHRIPLKHE
jgi:hypothetical protein